MARQRVNFYSGVISSLATSTPGTTTTITGNGLGIGFPIPTGTDYIPITLNPGYFGATNTSGPEVAYITAGGSSTIANVTRVMENSIVVTGTNVPWVAGPLVSDFDVTNLTSTGTLTLNNGLNGPLTVKWINDARNSFIYAGPNLTPFPLTIASGSYVSTSPYTISTSAAAVANIALSLPASGTYLITGQLTINNGSSSAASATLWLTTSGSASQINAPIVSYINFTVANQTNTIPMNGLVTTTGAATLTLYGQASNSYLYVVGGIGTTGATFNSIVAVRIS
jgi:hypothetical protein